MKKALVLYYSKTGNNRFLAHQLADALDADIEEIRPRINASGLILVSLGLGTHKIAHPVAEYEQVIVIGPIWMGQVIQPLRSVLKKICDEAKSLYFATCCGGGDEMKDDKFGYEQVFRKARKVAGDKLVACEAFPVPLILTEEERKDDANVMNVRLSEENFHGEIKERMERFAARIRQVEQPAGMPS